MTAAEALWGDWYTSTVDVDVPGPTASNGATTSTHYAAVPCNIARGQVLAPGGDSTEVVATTTVAADIAHRDKFPPGATVTMSGPTRRALIISVVVNEAGDELDGIIATVQ